MEKTTFLAVVATVVRVVMLVMVVLPAVIILRCGIGAGRRHLRRGPLDNLIQLTAIQPNPPAFRAKINLDTLTLGDI